MGIVGAHVLIYTPEAEAARSVLAKVFGFENIDTGEGWLIFRLPPAELGVHPSGGATKHAIQFMCDDIEVTMAEFRSKGLHFNGPAEDFGWGTAATALLPGGVEVMIYQPHHPRAIDL